MSVWYGHSTYPGVIIGTNSDSRLGVFGIRYHRLLVPIPDQRQSPASGPTLTYTADLVPLATVHIPPGASPQPVFAEDLPRKTTASTHGVGIYPVGLRLGFQPSSRIRPFLAGHSGMLYFFDPMPDARGKRLNFAVGVGVGLRASLTPKTILSVGYRFHHLSNGFRGSINPGLDANMLYVGVGRGF